MKYAHTIKKELVHIIDALLISKNQVVKTLINKIDNISSMQVLLQKEMEKEIEKLINDIRN
jgi:hypothetical protein